MFEKEDDFIEEAEERRQFQWVMPFLIGGVLAFLLCAGVAAAYVLKIGPFGANDRQAKIQSDVLDATGEVQQQIGDAAMEQEAAGLSPGGAQIFTIGQLQFGGSALQATTELASAESKGLVKCEPTLTGMEGGARSALAQVKCDIAATALTPASNPAQSTQPAAPVSASPAPVKAPSTLILGFANGNVNSIVYAAAGAPVPTIAAADDATPAAPGFQAPPIASASTDSPPAAPDDAPPAQ